MGQRKYRREGGVWKCIIVIPPRTGKLFRFRFVRACVRACERAKLCGRARDGGVGGVGLGPTKLGEKNRKRAPRYRETKFTRFFTASILVTIAKNSFRSSHPCALPHGKFARLSILDTIAKFGVARGVRGLQV